MKTIGPAFKGTELKPDANGAYIAPAPTNKSGWTAGFIEFSYDVGSPFQLKLTTAVRVTPDTLPFKGIDLTTAPYEPGATKVKVEGGGK